MAAGPGANSAGHGHDGRSAGAGRGESDSAGSSYSSDSDSSGNRGLHDRDKATGAVRMALHQAPSKAAADTQRSGAGGIGACPYYAARCAARKADLVLMPYAYLVCKNVRCMPFFCTLDPYPSDFSGNSHPRLEIFISASLHQCVHIVSFRHPSLPRPLPCQFDEQLRRSLGRAGLLLGGRRVVVLCDEAHNAARAVEELRAAAVTAPQACTRTALLRAQRTARGGGGGRLVASRRESRDRWRNTPLDAFSFLLCYCRNRAHARAFPQLDLSLAALHAYTEHYRERLRPALAANLDVLADTLARSADASPTRPRQANVGNAPAARVGNGSGRVRA